MLRRIAGSSMDQLAAFLTSPEVAPSTPEYRAAHGDRRHENSSPERAGIFRIFQPNADPAPSEAAEAPAFAGDEAVPLPRRRPPLAAAISAQETLTLAASDQ